MNNCPHDGFIAHPDISTPGIVCRSCYEPLCMNCGRPKDEHDPECPKVKDFNVLAEKIA